MRFALEEYINSLAEYTAKKLSGKIVKKDSKIRTPRDAINKAVTINEESRQWVVMKKRSDSNNDTTIDATVNEISDIDINYITAKHGDNRFNSTMNSNYSP